MRITKNIKKSRKRFVSVLLVLSVMLSLFVPFDLTLTAYAEDSGEEAATGNQIYALLYDVRARETDSNWRGYELVFQ